MARFLVKASEFKNVCKAVNDRKLAELKKEIIEILKKQDENEVKKAIDYFNSQELHYTHLEKSLVSGKWIEKAGYGVGTVRIWKGKKYKKIAPGKWARVFDKEGRGTNIAIGKLIARVNKIDNAEDLLQFVMENKQRFVDEDGRELSILDKVRAAVDTRNEKLSGESSPYVYGVGENVNRAKNEMFSKKDKIKKEEADLHKVSRKLSQIPTTELKQEKARLERAVANKTRSKRDSLNNTIFRESNQEKLDAINKELEKRSPVKAEKTVEDKIKENPDYPFKPKTDKERAERAAFEKDRDDFIERMDKIRQENKKKETDYSKMSEDELNELNKKLRQTIKEKDYGEADEEMEQINKISKQKIINSYKTKERHTLQHVEDVEQKKKMIADSKAIVEKDLARKEKQRIKESSIAKKNQLADEIDELKYKKAAFEQLENEVEKEPDNENKTYWIQDNRGNRLTNEDAKKKIIGQMKYLAELEDMAGKKMNNRLVRDTEYYIDYLKDRLNPEDRKEIESEAEKHQNRSDAMKGNQNAKKYGLTDEQIERYDIQEVVEDVNGYGIVKNSEGKYSYIDDGRVKDRPDDFETSIEKVKERINDTYETKKNIQAAKNFDFKNAKLGSDIEYTKRSDGTHLYFKKSPDGSKAISVTVEVSDMREPLNMTYEVTDTKSGKSWQYETAYGNKEGLEWAVERPEQMEKELKKFFKRDPNKEWEKQNTFEKETVIDRSVSTNNPEKLKPIAKSESIGEGKVKMSYSKEVSDEIKHLTNTSKDAVKKGSRYDFLTKIYYDKGNLVSTDGNKLKIVKVGELDGIDNGTFVDIDNSKEGIIITADKEFTKEHKFPQYERVIPDGNNEKIVLDNKALISKIKDLKKDGGITKKDSYVTMDIQGNNLMLDGVKVGDVSAANFEGENSDYINLDADILTSYLSGDKTDLYSSKDSSKAMYFGNGSAINIIMPQRKTESHIDANGKETIKQRRKDYESMRKDKEIGDEAKANKKAAQKLANQGYVDDIVNGYKRSVPADFEEKSIKKIQDWDLGTLERMYKVANADVDSLMDKKDFKSGTFDSFVYKNYNMSPHNFIGQNYAMKEHPAIVRELERLIKEKGGKIEKSLFDDFIVDVFEANDEEEIEDELYEGKTEYNDYSAEQPELFNSTAMKVREALDRINNQVL